MLALADTADGIGSRLLRRDPVAALPWFREAAAYAMFALRRRAAEAARHSIWGAGRALHNHAVESSFAVPAPVQGCQSRLA